MKTATVTTGKMINGNPKPEVPVEKLLVPDLWHTAMALRDHGMTQAADAVLDTWHLAHDLVAHARDVHAANVAMFSNPTTLEAIAQSWRDTAAALRLQGFNVPDRFPEDPPCVECGAPESQHDEGCTR